MFGGVCRVDGVVDDVDVWGEFVFFVICFSGPYMCFVMIVCDVGALL